MNRGINKEELPAGRKIGRFRGPEEIPHAAAEVAFLGRSNSGKSSLLASLLRNPKLVPISSKPGHTRYLEVYAIGQVNIVDMPGYGYASMSFSGRNRLSSLIGTYLENRAGLNAGFLMLDCKRVPSDEELFLAELFKKARRPLFLVLTKTDRLNRRELSKIEKRISEYEPLYHSILQVSARKHHGIDVIVNYIQSLA